MTGFLAIWCEIAPQDLADYRAWLTREHIADRTVLPGILGVRLFESPDNACAHFILYATQSPDVLRGPAYRAVLDNPSPWTRAIMPKFGPFDRALGRQVLKLGNGVGAHVCAWRIGAATPDLTQLARALQPLVGADGVVSLRLFALDRDSTDRHSEEKTMRGGAEGDFDLLLCAEAMTGTAARGIAQRLGPDLPDLFPTLTRADVTLGRMIYGEAAHELPMTPSD
ncbi:MAG: hypothetical protein KDK24_10695 [Pseudooceanicola sp.]|nr:hypothetical protein [Pseudooceanicola sp.]